MQFNEPFGPTKDHAEIRAWATLHQAHPVQKRVRVHDGEPAMLHFVFGELDEVSLIDLELISWESFFALFDVLELVLVSTGLPGRTHFELMRLEPRPVTVGGSGGESVE